MLSSAGEAEASACFGMLDSALAVLRVGTDVAPAADCNSAGPAADVCAFEAISGGCGTGAGGVSGGFGRQAPSSMTKIVSQTAVRTPSFCDSVRIDRPSVDGHGQIVIARGALILTAPIDTIICVDVVGFACGGIAGDRNSVV